MPIIIPEAAGGDRLYQNLQAANVPVIGSEAAARQDIRPARIGFLNRMPAAAFQSTELQWMRRLSGGAFQVEFIPIKFDNDERAEPDKTRGKYFESYRAVSEVVDDGLDGLVVTGDNLEIKPHKGFASGRLPEKTDEDDIRYFEDLQWLIDWAGSNVFSTIYSCLGGHLALYHKFKLERGITPEKTFGVYDHRIDHPDSPFTQDLNYKIRSPHSRWGNVAVSRLVEAGVRPLAVNEDIGWLLADADNAAGGRDLFVQGHPEYDAEDLKTEYDRDKALNRGVNLPHDYFENDDPDGPIKYDWATDARALYTNYLKYIYDHFSRQD